MTPVQTREETGVEAACLAAFEVAARKRDAQAALDAGDTDAYLHAKLALGHASSDKERQVRYVVAVEPAPRTTTRPPRTRRDRRLSGNRTAGRRTASRSAASRSAGGGGGGGSGDSDPDLDQPPSEAAAP